MKATFTTEQDYALPDRPQGKSGRAGVLMQRTKTVKAGDFLECEIFPVVMMDSAQREKRRKKSKEEITRANEERARRKLERLLNANFGEGDLLLHLTMAKPCPYAEMQQAVRNYIARLKYRAEKTCTACKYVYVIETTGEGERQRHHVHMVLGTRDGQWITRDAAECLWKHGLARADRCQRQEKGLCGFARYITMRKATQERLMRRSWGASKGLRQPTVTVSDRKFTRGAAGRIARGVEEDARAIFEKKYPGYRLIQDSVKIKYSDFLPGAYIYAFMEKAEAPHPSGYRLTPSPPGEGY